MEGPSGDTGTGMITLGGTVAEHRTYTDTPTGTVRVSGQAVDIYGDYCAGTITLTGDLAADYTNSRFSYGPRDDFTSYHAVRFSYQGSTVYEDGETVEAPPRTFTYGGTA